MSRKRNRNLNVPKSFVESMLDGMRKDPAMRPFLNFIQGIEPQIEFIPQEPIIQLQIPPEMYRKLLSLCHPDKHANSQTATEVTTWLLEQRELYGLYK